MFEMTSLLTVKLFAFAPFNWFLEDAYGAFMEALAKALGLPVLEYAFMQRAYLAAICIGVIGPLVGTFLVHREMSMIADTLAHTAFAGVAVGLFVNNALSLSLSPIHSALVVAIGTALLVELLVQYGDVTTDTSLAMILTGGFALGSVLITATDGGIAVGIDAYLFGSLTTVSRASVGLLVLMTGLVSVAVVITYRPLLYVTFDATAARAAGISVVWYNRLMVVLTALVVVSAMQVMGVILVAAMLVIPVATADSARSFKRSILAGILVAEVTVITGVTLSYQYGIAAGGTIVLTGIGLYVLSLGGRRLGLRTRAWRRIGRPGERVFTRIIDNTASEPKADGGTEDEER
ncbi:metal ABC transporter permease [Natrinema limicola]|uniref:ABC transporter integral membrane protein n=1 Tax=Natrinema limicola JCM 13563 TaxID=1230457 RepID=M0C393_9EURY|nr:metal ABC transporter permease [Natrinema limicola]ELZ17123.1 ABC transporter integral membrane protein [Natrinema limicola JCM 13563]